MYADVLSLLRCPTCYQSLTPHVSKVDPTGDILTGQLVCVGCTRHYPIHQGIGDFLGAPQPQTPAQWVNELPLTAWGYERLWRPFSLTLLSGERFPYRRELPLIAGWMQAARGGLYLDVACSNGLYARALTRTMAGAAGHVVGIDHALPMLIDARQRAHAAGLRISYVRAEAQALPFGSGAAHGVAIGGSLNEIGDLDGCIQEVRRTLRDDGYFVLMALLEAQGRLGRGVQRAFASGGVTFLPEAELFDQLNQHDLAVFANETHGIVLLAACNR